MITRLISISTEARDEAAARRAAAAFAVAGVVDSAASRASTTFEKVVTPPGENEPASRACRFVVERGRQSAGHLRANDNEVGACDAECFDFDEFGLIFISGEDGVSTIISAHVMIKRVCLYARSRRLRWFSFALIAV